ncbi:MAG: aspartate--tRNA ligase [Candidatus Liptonbacteria bacterium]|nr:aspartate--tRNA ligase [Candidatus Liptonbacteria bacterium]
MRISTAEVVKHEGKEVQLFGWVHSRRDHGKLVFIDLRDRSGLVQVVFGPEMKEAGDLRLEYVVKVMGKVAKRPEKLVNNKIATGAYEIQATGLEILSASKELPMPLDTDGREIGEDVRMKYRYLDLRRERLTRNLMVRHKVTKYIRDFLSERGFVEIETPYLGKSTPEGARDYLVPSRLQKGNFYALPQSPQQYKQLLMVGGLERYFQIVRCFRDEDTRGDRQPEFTQLDLEMSFVTQEDILNLTEELFIKLTSELFPEKKISTLTAEGGFGKLTTGKFPRLKYVDVMKKYHSDKPDLRKDKNDPNELAFAFVVDFPMFEKKDDGSIGAVHHPFTFPTFDTSLVPDDFKPGSENSKKLFKMLDSEKEGLKLSAYQYDFVLNGYEVGGGSIRTYDPALLKRVFEFLGNKPEEVEKQFGHMFEAFNYGVPPHGGIAPGIDRLVMLYQNESNIREVIAFPKTGDGRDLMMGAPSEVDKKQLDDLGLKLKG